MHLGIGRDGRGSGGSTRIKSYNVRSAKIRLIRVRPGLFLITILWSFVCTNLLHSDLE